MHTSYVHLNHSENSLDPGDLKKYHNNTLMISRKERITYIPFTTEINIFRLP